MPYFYAREIYNELFKENLQSILEKFRLEIVTILEPDIPDEKVREERRIVGWRPNSVGYLIWELIFDIYKLFQQEIISEYYDVDDEFSKYLEMYYERVKQSSWSDTIRRLERLRSFCGFSEFFGLKLESYNICWDNGKVIDGYVELENEKFSFTELFASLAPYMMTGLALLEEIKRQENATSFKLTVIL